MEPGNIISVTESSFEYDVIAYSQNTPVLTDFWAEWCKPCKVLTPILERIVQEAQGMLRLAMVDVDTNPTLALRFSVRSIPTVIAFSQGRRVADFAGLIPEPEVYKFVSQITPPSPADLVVQKGNSQLNSGDLDGARTTFLEALDLKADHPASMLGLMKVALHSGDAETALGIYRDFPASPEFNNAERLLPLAKVLQDYKARVLPNDSDLDAVFENSIRLISRGNTLAGIDGLLEILRQDKRYRKDRARNILLAVLDLLDPESPQTRAYRTELASILF